LVDLGGRVSESEFIELRAVRKVTPTPIRASEIPIAHPLYTAPYEGPSREELADPSARLEVDPPRRIASGRGPSSPALCVKEAEAEFWPEKRPIGAPAPPAAEDPPRPTRRPPSVDPVLIQLDEIALALRKRAD
jgi:hypothetical protein